MNYIKNYAFFDIVIVFIKYLDYINYYLHIVQHLKLEYGSLYIKNLDFFGDHILCPINNKNSRLIKFSREVI